MDSDMKIIWGCVALMALCIAAFVALFHYAGTIPNTICR